MGCEVKVDGGTKWAPLCQPRIWLSAGVFKWGIQAIEPFEGDASQVDCRRCLLKMQGGVPCPRDMPEARIKLKQLKQCRQRQLAVQRQLERLHREMDTLRELEAQLVEELAKLNSAYRAAEDR